MLFLDGSFHHRQIALASWNDPAAAINGFLSAEHEIGSKVIILADVFEEFLSGFPEKVKTACPWRGIGAGIVDCDFVLDRVRVGAGEAFDQVKLFGTHR